MPDLLHAPHAWLTRLLLQRGLGAIYLIAFGVALTQFRALLGERGLMPVPRFLARVRFRDAPSLFHLGYSDRRLVWVATLGALGAAAIVLGLPDGWPAPLGLLLWLVLWALYLSIVNVGQTFYAFGWESLLLEAGLLAAFLGPAGSAVPAPILILFRWLVFRLEFGAGMIKMRGDACWRDLTCLDYHHETQPMPNPLSWFFHRLPRPLHRVEVLGSHFAQLVVPWFLFFPQPIASWAGLVIVITQSWLVISGNYAWLNVLTLVLGISAFDDAALRHVLPLQIPAQHTLAWHDGLVIAVTLGVIVLSWRPAKNLFSSDQKMNASFDPLHLVNTYGAFGSVTRERYEVVVEGTDDPAPDETTVWREYGFKGKPGDPKRWPRQFAPWHLRLDWLMWFAAFSQGYARPWFYPLLRKLLENDRAVLELLRHNPFPDRPPRAVRAVHYLYRYSTWRERRETGAWWVRQRVGLYTPAVTLQEGELVALHPLARA